MSSDQAAPEGHPAKTLPHYTSPQLFVTILLSLLWVFCSLEPQACCWYIISSAHLTPAPTHHSTPSEFPRSHVGPHAPA